MILGHLLGQRGKVKDIGKEIGDLTWTGVSLFISPTKSSYRYVYSIDGEIISALQIISNDGKIGVVANVVTRPDHRRKKYATILWNVAIQKFNKISHSSTPSKDGLKWINSL